GVHSVVFSPSGQQIASGSYDNTVRLWDAQTGAPGAILSGHAGCVCSVVFSPSGQQIASGSDDNTVRLWDAQTGAPGAILSGHTDSVNSVVFSPSGQQIASGSDDKTLRLWDVKSGLCLAAMKDFHGGINSIAWNNQRKHHRNMKLRAIILSATALIISDVAFVSATLREVTDESFQAEVLDSDETTLVRFYTPWCSHSQIMTPVVQAFAQRHQRQITVVQVNIDANPRTALQYGVTSVPTTAIFRQGQLIDKMAGELDEQKLEQASLRWI
ncbi:hypothetical protein BGZ67_004886, partial [Mortierella alpina]